ncbi:MAG TPA: hypothetical protein VER96_31110 [Polyangiaceae bacterium]|nr:hypothetical protein [Polyangiaceae bacterium]
MFKSTLWHCATHRPSALLGLLAALGAAACGSSEHTEVAQTDGGPEQAEVASGVNVCPLFEGSLVMPQMVRVGENASISVHAKDPDGADSRLVFAWTASSGSFDPSDKSVTSYTCAESGVQELLITARDRPGCISSLTVLVQCIGN